MFANDRKLRTVEGQDAERLARKLHKGQGREEAGKIAGIEGVDHNGHNVNKQNAHGGGDRVVQTGALSEHGAPQQTQQQGTGGKEQNKLQHGHKIDLGGEKRC